MAMKVGGSILLDKNGSFQCVSPQQALSAICDFASMVKEADDCKDKLYYDSEEWELFYANSYDSANNYWKGVGDIAFSMLVGVSNPVFRPIKIAEGKDYDSKPNPKVRGGFPYCGHPEEYVYDKTTIDVWHIDWFKKNPDKIDWKGTNGVMPCRDKVIEILREKLKELQERIKVDANAEYGFDFKDKTYIKSLDVERLDSTKVVNCFYDFIMKHKRGISEMKSYAEELANIICKANFYNDEQKLVDMENKFRRDRENKQTILRIIGERKKKIPKSKNNKKDDKQPQIYEVFKIYSMQKDGKYHFLSLDIEHGMFELCDDKGNHIGEFKFDGSMNGENTAEPDHGLYCVEEWKAHI